MSSNKIVFSAQFGEKGGPVKQFRSLLGLVVLLAAVLETDALTFSVINENDSGGGSLRQAIINCNSSAGDDTITFDIPGIGPHFLSLTSQLPDITSNITFLNDRATDEEVNIFCPSSGPSFNMFILTAGHTVTFAGLGMYEAVTYAIENDGSSVTVRNCFIGQGDTGLGNIGSAGNAANLTVLNTTIFGNSSSNGSGLTQSSGSGGQAHSTFTNCTFSFNSATAGGAGSAIDSNGGNSTTLLVNCTLADNTAQASGANVYIFNGATVQALNSIFQHAGSVANIQAVSGGMFSSLGHNLSDEPDGGDLGTGPGGFFGGSGDKRNTNPLLGPLSDNGGLPFTYAIPANSPALEAGDDAVLNFPYGLTTDERGALRKSGTHVDIGAYEREQVQQSGSIFTVTAASTHDDGVCGPVDCTINEAVNAANSNADANTIKFLRKLLGSVYVQVPGGLSITHPVTILGPGARSLSINGINNRVFYITPGAGNVSISDLELAFGTQNGANFPDNCGGLIYNAASLTLTRCSLRSGEAVFGGAIYNDGSGRTATLTMMDCTISFNRSGSSASAILNGGYNNGHATANLTNCTIARNICDNGVAAIYNDGNLNGNASLTLTNCTFFNNTGTGNTSGVYNDALNPDSFGTATTTTRNTIFRVNNPATDGANLFNDDNATSNGTIVSQGHNLSNDNAGGDGMSGPGGYLNAAGDWRNQSPELASLTDAGGATDTVPFTSATPIPYNAGDDAFAPPRDQRGFTRNGVSDIGAFEIRGHLAPVSAASRKVHGAAGTFDIPLPLTGTAGIECRQNTTNDPPTSPNFGKDHQVVVTFGGPVTVQSASVTSTTLGDSPSATFNSVGNDVVVDLHNIPALPRRLTITLNNASHFDTGTFNIPLSILLADATGSGGVNASDVSQVKSKSGQTVGATNFRTDITLSGSINASDISLAKAKSGTALPPAAPARPTKPVYTVRASE
jgi:hypothetical protein